MKMHELVNASGQIVKGNITEKVVAATALWDQGASKLTVTYYVDGNATDEEQELCDLTLTELLAEFSEVTLADSRCVSADVGFDELRRLEGLVYLRQ